MAEKLSGVTVVIFIACGILTFILLFIFAKRQIMRFALRSRRGPHIPIGHGAKTSIKKEIEHHIEMIPKIIFEPPLQEEYKSLIFSHSANYQLPHNHRLKTVIGVKLLEKEIAKRDPSLQRVANENLRSFLLLTLVSPVYGSNQKLIHQFCDLYEHARYDPSEFGEEDYQTFFKILIKLIDIAKLIRLQLNSKKSSPSKTPIKKVANNENITGIFRKLESAVQKVDHEAKPKILFMDDNETSV